ncbi:transcriptional regulator, partial [Coprobacillus cateniformis]|nr:transcriptional regulator [Coprobacillus cateniformis]
TNIIYSEDGTKSKECKAIFVIISQSPQSNMQFERIIPVIIELPELKDRSIKERFGLINHFFSNEASHSMRSIEVTSETIRALLLSDFDYNVKELKFEIKAACANAYVRVVRDIHQNIQVVVNDFKNQVRKSLIKLKNNHIEIEALLDSRNVLI